MIICDFKNYYFDKSIQGTFRVQYIHVYKHQIQSPNILQIQIINTNNTFI